MKTKFLRALLAYTLLLLSLAFAGFIGYHASKYLIPLSFGTCLMLGIMIVATLALILLDLVTLEWAFGRKMMPDFIGRIADLIANFP